MSTVSESATQNREPGRYPSESDRGPARSAPRFSFSLAWLLTLLLLIALGSAYLVTLSKLRSAEAELARLRVETGYLAPCGPDEIAAVRLPVDQPMSYRIRVRVPETTPYRVAYSSFWPKSSSSPQWFGAVQVPPGESMIWVRILKDPRDERWKIAVVQPGSEGTRRMATALPEPQVAVFLRSNDWLRSGVSNKTETISVGESLRLLDERVLVGEGAMMLYGDRPPDDDMVGIFAELQPDVGAL